MMPGHPSATYSITPKNSSGFNSTFDSSQLSKSVVKGRTIGLISEEPEMRGELEEGGKKVPSLKDNRNPAMLKELLRSSLKK